MNRPARSRTAGRCISSIEVLAVSGTLNPRPRMTSTGTFIADGETALQLTQRRASASQARSFIASAPRN